MHVCEAHSHPNLHEEEKVDYFINTKMSCITSDVFISDILHYSKIKESLVLKVNMSPTESLVIILAESISSPSR